MAPDPQDGAHKLAQLMAFVPLLSSRQQRWMTLHSCTGKWYPPVSVWFISSSTQMTRVTAHMVAFSMWQYSVACEESTHQTEEKIYSS